MTLPLAGLRIAITLPPHGWFGGVDYNFAIEMSEELRVLGATVFDVDVAGFTSQNEIYIDNVVEALKNFHPDVAVSLPNALYILLCVTRGQKNIFRDILRDPHADVVGPRPAATSAADPESLSRYARGIAEGRCPPHSPHPQSFAVSALFARQGPYRRAGQAGIIESQQGPLLPPAGVSQLCAAQIPHGAPQSRSAAPCPSPAMCI